MFKNRVARLVRDKVLLMPVLAVTAAAQPVNFSLNTVRRVEWRDGVLREPRGYSSREVAGYDSYSESVCGRMEAISHMLEDVSFGPSGPWAGTNVSHRSLRRLSFPVANSELEPTSLDVRVTIWSAGTFSASPMVSGTGNILWQDTFSIQDLPNGAYLVEAPVDSPVDLPLSVYVELEYFVSGTTTRLPVTSGSPMTTFVVDIWPGFPGSTGVSLGMDRDNDGVLEGGAPNATENEQSTFAGGTCDGWPVSMGLILSGETMLQSPTVHADLGSLANSLNRTDSFSSGGGRWYSFETTERIADDEETFLDIWNSGSGVSNTSMALFGSDGGLIALDLADGTGEYAQLTFGIGRRQRNSSTAVQFDGSDGELAAGLYYLLVQEGNAGFADGFGASPVPAGGQGTVSLAMRSNIVGGALAPSVAPVAQDLGILYYPGATGSPWYPGAENAVWYRIGICSDLADTGATKYLDIDFSNSDHTDAPDPAAFLFDEFGNMVAYSDDEGGESFPKFSFGSTALRGPYVSRGSEFSGENGELPAGVYYVAVGHNPIFAPPSLANSGRWHLRAGGIDTAQITVDFYVGYSACSSNCPMCPADFDESGGVDGGDVEAFYAAWELGDGCADMNNDGGVDGGDIEPFLTIWGAGDC